MINIALQFGHIRHFNEGLSEFGRQLGLQLASRAPVLQAERAWRFHFILPSRWHGMFGDAVTYRELQRHERYGHFSVPRFDVWHGLHQHMRYRMPWNCRFGMLTLHDLNHVYAKSGISLWWQNVRLRRQLRGLDRVVAISEFVRRDIERQLPWAPPVQVIYNGVANLDHVTRESVDFLKDRPYFLHLSRMSPSKNVEALIEMAAIWPEKCFVLAGPSSIEVERHRASVSDRGLNNVMFMTDVTEGQKAWLYEHCEAFLFPSLMEGFGLPPIEAMRFGRPLFVAGRSCLPEVCGAGAVYWQQFSPQYMKATVESGLQLWPGKRDVQAKRVARYDWSVAANRYIELYDEATR